MSNVFAGDTTDMNLTASSISYEGCISIVPTETNTGTGADGVNVRYTATGASNVCIGIAKASAKLTGFTAAGTDSNMTHQFGGSGVVW